MIFLIGAVGFLASGFTLSAFSNSFVDDGDGATMGGAVGGTAGD